ncbi:FAD-binding protein [uncultured Desulfovibrio sp.]|uniref:FAD-binding protein n=1 Tax=uncultured Desulfovibrio sp. TaxID=167968 RepID=UPI002804A7C6|nr:FAD-binding protein [uncultured Desulfovibrio sp.]
MSMYSNVFVVSDKATAFNELLPLAARLGATVEAVCPAGAEGAARAFALGASRVLLLPAQEGQFFENYVPTIARAVKERSAPDARTLVLLPSDKRGKAVAAKIGVALGAAVISDVNAISDAGFCRMVHGGLAQGVETPTTPIVVVTVAPGAFPAQEAENGEGEAEELTFIAPANGITMREVRPRAAASVNVGKARRLVAVGRGFAKKEDLALARALAEAMGAELACSRPIAEGEQWLERERYVGVSGVMVKPAVYLAVGISGQIQHMVGARESSLILAVNKDKNAPIFGFADYGIVGDLYKILPVLTNALG